MNFSTMYSTTAQIILPGVLCVCFGVFFVSAELPNYSEVSTAEEVPYRFLQPNRFETTFKDYDDDDVDVPGNTIPGVPGRDFPTYDKVPATAFSCSDRIPGFYADEETRCQVWHYCRDGVKHSFLCPNGTIYNQRHRVCEWWFNVRCENTEAESKVNEDLYIVPSSTESSENPYRSN